MAIKETLIRIEKVRAGYGELEVLRGIDLEVRPGEIVALIGPNGAGKSTILKTIYGLTKISSGKVFLRTRNITNTPPHQLLPLGICYVPQGRINFGELTVQENLELALNGIPKEEQNNRLQIVHKRFPVLKQKAKLYAYSLSGGEQQMLALGRALLLKPKIILMDEPSLGLSPLLQQELFKLIQNLRKDGIAVLLVEQNAKKAIESADRTYLLEQGTVVLSGGKSILKDKRIKNVYLGGE